MSNVKALPGTLERGQADPEVVELLGNLLALAKEGNIRGLAVCYEREDGRVVTATRTKGDLIKLGYAIGALDFRFKLRMYEDSKDGL